MNTLPARLSFQPLSRPLNATVRVPGSKSLTNRALLIAALANGTSTLTNALFCDDSRYFADALKTLGFALTLDERRQTISLTGRGGEIPSAQAEIFVGNAGTAARFLSALLTLGRGEFLLDGDARMRQRPIADLLAALTQLGAKVESIQNSNGSPPVKIIAAGLRGGKAKIAGDISSQFLSALLMVAPYAQTPVEIELSSALNSQPYVAMTLAVMQDFGVEVERAGFRAFRIAPARFRARPSYPIESDASAASYFFAAPAICGGAVKVENISRRARQGDIHFLEVLEKMGCAVSEAGSGLLVCAGAELRGVEVDLRDMPDTAQTLAAIAPFASTPTTIRGIASARVKESDRISATCAELRRLGARVEEYADGMTIYPCPTLRPAAVQTYNDHRMAMAFSLIGLRVAGVTIENPACVSKTFPNFFDVLKNLEDTN